MPGGVFLFLVSANPDKFGKPVKVIPGLKYPNCVAFDSKGKLFVTEFSQGLAVVNKSGSWLPSIAQTAFNCPLGGSMLNT